MNLNRTLLTTITDRASNNFIYNSDEINTPAEFSKWQSHWFETAETFYNELVKDGLTKTAISVREHIDYQKNVSFSPDTP